MNVLYMSHYKATIPWHVNAFNVDLEGYILKPVIFIGPNHLFTINYNDLQILS